MIGQMSSMMDKFRERFGRPPSAGEWYLLGKHGLDSVSGMMANPGTPAWVAAYNANRTSGATPDSARSAIWGSLPRPVQKWFPQGPNGLTGDAYLGVHAKVPYANGTGGPSPNWAALFGGNALGATRLGGSPSGGQSGSPGGVWPWGGGGGTANQGSAQGGLGGVLGNWNGSGGQRSGMGSSGNALSQYTSYGNI